MTPSYGPGRAKRLYDAAPVPVQNALTTAYGWRLARRAYGGAYAGHLRRIAELQYAEPDVLAAHRLAQLRRLLAFAHHHAPHWRRVLEAAGLEPEALTDAADLRALPLLEKEQVRRHGDALIAGPARTGELPSVPVRTSGTTGKGLQLLVSLDAWRREYAYRWLHRSWAGIERGVPTATLAGQPVVPVGQRRPPFWRYNAVERQLLFSSQHIGAATADAYVDRLLSFRPVLVHGYPSALSLVARRLLDRGERLVAQAVFTHSETLLAAQEALLREAFGCAVFNWYGTSEHVGNIVGCEAGSLHVKADHSHLEFLRPGGEPAAPGEVAEIVGTSFANLAMPLVRYRVGDTAVLAEGRCVCGRNGPLVERIEGRVEDFIVTPDGRAVGRLDHAFKKAHGVVEAQLYQERPELLEVRVVTAGGLGEGERDAIAADLRMRLGDAVELRFVELAAIPRGPGGKLRFAVSRVAQPVVTVAGGA